MRARTIIITVMGLIPLVALGRILLIKDPKTLIADSQLVFVGKVQSVKPSGIATSLIYPTWEGVSFPWLTVEMEVMAPFKGVRKDEVVRIMMLSISKSEKAQSMDSPPQVLEPDSGDIFFLCLSRTPIKNTFAAISAPYDENLSVIPLYRSRVTDKHDMRDIGKHMLSDDKSYELIWRLVNAKGELLPENVAKMRKTYAAEIRKVGKKDLVYLEWQAYTNAHGWISDVPKGSSPTNSKNQKMRIKR